MHKMTQEVEHRVSHDAQGVFAVADLNSCRDLLGRVPQTPHPFLAAVFSSFYHVFYIDMCLYTPYNSIIFPILRENIYI